MIRIIHSKILGGWFIVRGPHQTPIGGRFETRAQALAPRAHVERLEDALRWALEQIEDDLCPDHQAALADAWSLVEDE